MSTSNLSISTCNILVCQHITYLCQNEILCVNMQLIYVDSQTHYFTLFNITNDTFKMINSKTSFVSFFNLPICFLHENYSKYPSSIIPLELWLDSKSTRTVWLVICWIDQPSHTVLGMMVTANEQYNVSITNFPF